MSSRSVVRRRGLLRVSHLRYLLFHDQLGAMVQTGDDGLIAGIGMSNITLDHLLLLRALEVAEIVCVQNLFSSAGQQHRDRSGVSSRFHRGVGRASVARTGPNESLTASELSLGACG